MPILIFAFVGLGLLQVAIALPLIQRRVKPNLWYGFRTPRTLRDKTVWYEVNAHAGKRLLISGILIMIAAAVFALVPGISTDNYAWLVLAVLVVSLGIGLTQSFLYLHDITK